MKTSIFTLSFDGTIGRLQYLGGNLAVYLVMFVALVPMFMVIEPEFEHLAWLALPLLGIVLVSVVWAWSLATRRMRDTGANPWWVLTLLIPYVSLIPAVFLLFVPHGSLGKVPGELPIPA